MDTITIESRNFILSGINAPSKLVIERHGKFWHVEEEKYHIPKLNGSGYILKSLQDNHIILLKKRNSQHFKVENEFYTEEEICLSQEDL